MKADQRKIAEKVAALNTNIIVLKSSLVKAEAEVNRVKEAIKNNSSLRLELLEDIEIKETR